MEYTTLGRTGVKVSRISLGTWSYGGSNISGNNQPIGWHGQTNIDSQAALRKAYELSLIHI